MKKINKTAAQLHQNVPPDWYYASMKRNLLQKIWHFSRFWEVGKLVEPTGGVILDIGSADGMFTKQILEKSHADKIIGIDVLKKSVEWANKHWKKDKQMQFKLGDAHKLKFSANTFDAVFALEVLEHVFDPTQVFSEVKRVLKKGGYAVFLVPTDNFIFKIVWWFVTSFWWAKIWQDCHVQSFTSTNSLAKATKKAGFKIEVDKRFWLGMLNVVKVRKIK